MTPIAGAVTGFISYAVGKYLDGKGPGSFASWQWLFIIEGAPTILWGLIVWALLPQFPDKEVKSKYSLWFKSDKEKRLIVERSMAGESLLLNTTIKWLC